MQMIPCHSESFDMLNPRDQHDYSLCHDLPWTAHRVLVFQERVAAAYLQLHAWCNAQDWASSSVARQPPGNPARKYLRQAW